MQDDVNMEFARYSPVPTPSPDNGFT